MSQALTNYFAPIHMNPNKQLRIQTKIDQVFVEKEMKFCFRDYKFKDFTHEFIFTTKGLLNFLETHFEQISFISILNETLKDPYEIWQQFQEHHVTRQVRLQYKFIKTFDLKNEKTGLIVIFAAVESSVQFKEFFVIREPNISDQLNQFRSGKLVFARDKPQLDA